MELNAKKTTLIDFNYYNKKSQHTVTYENNTPTTSNSDKLEVLIDE